MKKGIYKMLRVLMAACMVAVSVAACKTNVSESQDTAIKNDGDGGETDSADGNTQESVKSITIGTGALWDTLTPFQTTSNQYHTMVRLAYDRLAFQKGDGTYIPQVAKTWEVEADGVTWNVEIYDYVVDSQGNAITSDDIVWMIQESMDQALKPCFNKVKSVEKTGDYTFKVVMKQNIVDSFEQVLTSTYVVSKKAYDASTDGFSTDIVSTSPYKVTEFVSGSSLTFEKREDYWQKEELIDPALASNLDKVTYTLIKEASQQQVALETGTVDAFDSISATIVPAFEGNEQYSIVQLPSSNGTQLFFSGHSSRSISSDENLCKAICHAIDAEGIIAGAYSGYAEPMHDVAVKTVVGYLDQWDSQEYFTYDVELAKEYLEKSDYNGEELVMLCMSDSTIQRVAQMIQSYLLQIGIQLKLNIVDSALFSAQRFDGSQYDMIIVNVGAGSLPGVWSNRFDSTAYEMGDGTARNDETLTDMLYKTWTQEGFTEENIDAVHQYIIDHAYAYGICLPMAETIYSNKLGLKEVVNLASGTVDFAACTYE